MTTYTILTGLRSVDGSIKNWVNDDRVPATIILTMAQQWIYERLRIREMLTSTSSAAFVAGTPAVSVPARFKAPYMFHILGATISIGGPSEVVLRPLAEVRARWSWSADNTRVRARPSIYGIDGSSLQFDMVPDQAYPYDFVYYQSLAPLASSTNETNVLTDRYLSLLYHACCMKAYEHLRRAEERKYHLTMALGEIEAVNQDSDMAMESMELDVRVV